MPAELISLDYGLAKSDIVLAQFPALIGSEADAQIRLEDQSISPRHCEIDFINGSLVVRDLDSVHGTFVNGTRIEQASLAPGDELTIGMLTFLVQGEPDPSQAPARGNKPEERQGRQERPVSFIAS